MDKETVNFHRRTARRHEFVGGRFDGLSERGASEYPGRSYIERDVAVVELMDPIAGTVHRYEFELRSECWKWAGYVREKV